jgi:DNA-binding HxlR family transcriptional regulator
MQQDILDRLEALQKELDELGETISESRSAALRHQVLDDLRALLGEYNREILESEIERLRPTSSCKKRDACLELIRNALGEARAAYEKGDDATARAALANLVDAKAMAHCQDATCSAKTDHLFEETSRMISISSRLGSSIPQQVRAEVPDEQVGEALMPLAHSARISILSSLSPGSLAFSDMSNKVGLRTGHLQFHLKTLIKAGLVEKEGKRGHYRMTEKGRKALAGSRRLAAEMA